MICVCVCSLVMIIVQTVPFEANNMEIIKKKLIRSFSFSVSHLQWLLISNRKCEPRIQTIDWKTKNAISQRKMPWVRHFWCWMLNQRKPNNNNDLNELNCIMKRRHLRCRWMKNCFWCNTSTCTHKLLKIKASDKMWIWLIQHKKRDFFYTFNSFCIKNSFTKKAHYSTHKSGFIVFLCVLLYFDFHFSFDLRMLDYLLLLNELCFW